MCHLLLDDDECDWPYNSDPDMDIIFGPGGIPRLAWHGQNIFNNTEKWTPAIVTQAVKAKVAEEEPAEQDESPRSFDDRVQQCMDELKTS